MKRLVWLVLIVALALTAASLREPETTLVTFRPAIILEGQEAAAGVWYCPWLQSSFERSGSVAAASVVPATASFTFPNPEPGQDADTVSLDLAGPGAVALTMTDVAVRGSVPGFVEFSDGPAGAAVLIESDTTVSADSCIASQPKVWYLTGGSTAQDESLTLRLFNPFPEGAIVTAAAVSEFGPEPLPGFDAIPVPPRSFVDLILDEELRLRESVSVTVIAAEGIVIPAFAMANPEDEAFWTGTGLSTRWEFPVVRGGAIEPQLAITNPGTTAARSLRARPARDAAVDTARRPCRQRPRNPRPIRRGCCRHRRCQGWGAGGNRRGFTTVESLARAGSGRSSERGHVFVGDEQRRRAGYRNAAAPVCDIARCRQDRFASGDDQTGHRRGPGEHRILDRFAHPDLHRLERSIRRGHCFLVGCRGRPVTRCGRMTKSSYVPFDV
jgi:hypothetical protein